MAIYNHIDMWYVYIVRCSKDDSLYTGITNNLDRRIEQHNSGRGAKYTKGRGPLALIKFFSRETKGEALQLEYKIKQMSRNEKLQYNEPQDENLPEENREDN